MSKVLLLILAALYLFARVSSAGPGNNNKSATPEVQAATQNQNTQNQDQSGEVASPTKETKIQEETSASNETNGVTEVQPEEEDKGDKAEASKDIKLGETDLNQQDAPTGESSENNAITENQENGTDVEQEKAQEGEPEDKVSEQTDKALNEKPLNVEPKPEASDIVGAEKKEATNAETLNESVVKSNEEGNNKENGENSEEIAGNDGEGNTTDEGDADDNADPKEGKNFAEKKQVDTGAETMTNPSEKNSNQNDALTEEKKEDTVNPEVNNGEGESENVPTNKNEDNKKEEPVNSEDNKEEETAKFADEEVVKKIPLLYKGKAGRKQFRIQNEAKRNENLKTEGLSILRKFNLHEQDPETMCNTDLLRALGVQDDLTGVMKATSEEKNFCDNDITCCSKKNFESIQVKFKEGVRDLNYRIDMLEELLTLFHGQAYFDALHSLMSNGVTKCDYVFESSEKRAEFVSQANLDENVDNINALLTRVDDYRKNALRFHGDLLCAACNPINSSFIDSKEKILRVNGETCSIMLQQRQFEAKVAQAFVDFLVPYANVMECLRREREDGDKWYVTVYNDENDDEIQEDVVTQKLIVIDGEHAAGIEDPLYDQELQSKLLEIKRRTNINIQCTEDVSNLVAGMQSCYYKHFSMQSEECRSVCVRPIASTTFAIPFFDDVAAVLKATYEGLTLSVDMDVEIEDYYKDVRGVEFSMIGNDEPVVFFVPNSSVPNSGLDYKIVVAESESIPIFNHKVSKQFLIVSEPRKTWWRRFIDSVTGLFA